MNLRTRLAVFIALSVALALLVQGVSGYLSFRQQAFASLDRDLAAYLNRVEQNVFRRRGDRGGPGPLTAFSEDFVARARVIYRGTVYEQDEGFPEDVPLEPTAQPQTYGMWRVVSRLPNGNRADDLYIQVAVSSREVIGSLVRYRQTLFLTILSVSALGAVVALLVSRPALRPLHYLLTTAKAVASSGDLSLRVPAGGEGELGELSETFNHMLERLAAFRARESAFTRSASHELRTPLTAMKLHLGSLRAGYTTTEETVAALEQELDRMTRLSEALLTLAREGRAERVEVDLASLVKTVAREAKAAYLGEETLALVGDPLLIHQALTNLTDNARLHAPEADLKVTLEVRRDAGQRFAVVTVADTGPGLNEQERKRVTEAFYRTPGTTVQGSGLGLAVATQVAEAHGGQLRLCANFPRGLKVELWLASGG